MKIIATSDLHGNLPLIEEPFDLMLIAGDIAPAHSHYYAFQFEWLMNDFVEWVNSLPINNIWSKVILVPGNHDYMLERISHSQILEFEQKCNGRLKFLRHDLYEFEFPVSDGLDSLTIFGTPYCSIFGNWAFMINDEALDKKFVAEAKEEGMINLNGHRSIGGMRASIYNAMPEEGVDKLIEFMKKFEQENR